MQVAAKMDGNFQGLVVAAFETRRAAEMAELITRRGGVPIVAPAMREVVLEENDAAVEFGRAMMHGELNAVVFMTGAGAKALLHSLAGQYTREQILEGLSSTAVIARGSKTVRALEEAGLRIAVKAPEPNTWREVLCAIDEGKLGFELAGCRIALQEYGSPDDRLVKDIEARGASVLRVPVYRWAMPEDTAPLAHAVGEIAASRVDVVLFTNAVQVDHLFSFAQQEGFDRALRDSLEKVLVCSIGPTCSEALEAHGLRRDLEPEPHKLGMLVHEAARRAPELLREKRAAFLERRATSGIAEVASAPAFPSAERSSEISGAVTTFQHAWQESRFLKACRREPVDATPVWLMRQAGRYMKEYRDLRERVPFLELCKRPELVAEITVSAARRIGADAAILFADLLLPAEPMGFKIEYERGGGPYVSTALETAARVRRLPEFDVHDALDYVFEAVRRARAGLDDETPLIGFAGAPFTFASYLIEGGASRSFTRTKRWMYSDSGAWRALMDYLVQHLAAYINGQIDAGAQAVQVFDSWVGCLAPSAYREFVLPHMKRLFRQLSLGTPVIHFGTGTAQLLELMREAGGDVIGLDYRVELDEAWRRLGPGVGVQGNLDPAILFAEPSVIRQHATRILHQAHGRPGHVFNLGHGVLPETPVEHVTELIQFVHEESARLASAPPRLEEDERAREA